jgi:DNA transformation protein and related proteins
MMRSANPKTVSRNRTKAARPARNLRRGPESLLGLGPMSLRVLRAAGISTRAELERLGPVKAFIAAKRIDPSVTLNLLWGIAGAVTDTHWSKLPVDLRSSLLLEYDGLMDAERARSTPARKPTKRTRHGQRAKA